MATARLLAVGFVFYLKQLAVSWFYLFAAVFMPVIYASIGFFMFQQGGRSRSLLSLALGTGMMGIWMVTLFGSGMAIQLQRWRGTLELLVASPPPFIVVLLPFTVATATVGLYSIVARFFGVGSSSMCRCISRSRCCSPLRS